MINQPMPGLTPEAGDKRYLKTTGGTMSGDIAMGGKKVTGLGTPTANGDAATKQYADNPYKTAVDTIAYRSVVQMSTNIRTPTTSIKLASSLTGAIVYSGITVITNSSGPLFDFILPVTLYNQFTSTTNVAVSSPSGYRLLFVKGGTSIASVGDGGSIPFSPGEMVVILGFILS